MKRLFKICLAASAIAITLTVVALAVAARSEEAMRADAIDIGFRKPFCIQGPVGRDIRDEGGVEYKTTRIAHGFLHWPLIGSGGVHHAVLVVGDGVAPRTYHWSYFKQQFVEGTYGPLPIVCRPSHVFFEEADGDADSATVAFLLGGRRMRIPRQYLPRAHWPDSLLGYSLTASGPHFEPVGAGCASPDCPSVFVAFERDGKPFGIAQTLPPHDATTMDGDLAGLVRLSPHGGEEYVQVDQGKVVTSIRCWKGCLHAFSHDGLTFSFRHSTQDLPQWRAMQARLIALHARFEQ